LAVCVIGKRRLALMRGFAAYHLEIQAMSNQLAPA
jgi:hypothetical protein